MATRIDSTRILVVANETVESPALREAIETHAERIDAAEVTIVAPALNTRLRHWLSDDERARREAELRLADPAGAGPMGRRCDAAR